MSKVLFSKLFAISFGLVFLAASGCFRETELIYAIGARNSLDGSIYYCFPFEVENCQREIKAGEIAREYFSDRSSKFVYRPDMFDSLVINLCGEPIEFSRVRAVSQVFQAKEQLFEVVIDKSVYSEFCAR